MTDSITSLLKGGYLPRPGVAFAAAETISINTRCTCIGSHMRKIKMKRRVSIRKIRKRNTESFLHATLCIHQDFVAAVQKNIS